MDTLRYTHLLYLLSSMSQKLLFLLKAFQKGLEFKDSIGEDGGLEEIFFQMLSIFKGAIAWKTFAHRQSNKRLQSRKLTLEKCFDLTSVKKEANECLDKCSRLTRSAEKVNTDTLRHSISHISQMRGWLRR